MFLVRSPLLTAVRNICLIMVPVTIKQLTKKPTETSQSKLLRCELCTARLTQRSVTGLVEKVRVCELVTQVAF